MTWSTRTGAFVAGPTPLAPVAGPGNPPIEPGTSFYIRGYSRGAQTAWLRRTLAEARPTEGRAEAGLHRVRDVHPDPPPAPPRAVSTTAVTG